MKTINRTGAALLGVAAIAALSSTAGYAYTTYAKWSSTSVTFTVNPANADLDPSIVESAISSAMESWNTQAGTPLRISYGGRTNDTSTGYDGRNVMVMRNASNGSAIASTYSWYSGSTLVDADIVFWDAAFSFTAGNLGCSGGVYLEDVTTHELGHAIGLNHSSVADATMYPSYGYCSQELRSLAADDIAGAQNLYGTAKATNTAPSVSITSPSNNASFPEGSSVSFSGSASDTQDGALSSQLLWTSNVDGVIGTGGSFSRPLSAGAHVVTATVTDSGGLSTTRQVSISVVASTNTAPTVTILSPALTSFVEGSAISFAGSGSDAQDGNITARMVWTSHLLGQIGTGGSFTRSLTAGNHVITATVTDNNGATSAQQLTLSITAPVAPPDGAPTLAASGYKVKGAQRVDLTWSGFSGTSVEVYRNGSRVTTTTNDGAWTDMLNVKGGGSYRYKLCEVGTTVCSNESVVTF